MTTAVEFTYLYNGFSLRIDGNTLTRAVRVKNTVKDKIKRVFEAKQTVVTESSVAVEPEVKESLIDLSQEKIVELNNAMNVLQTGINAFSPNRAVLFTQPLVAKIFRVTDKWFEGMPVVEKKVELVSPEISNVNMNNHLGGEVVPGNWNKVEENEMTQESTLTLEPTLEAVPEVNIDDEPAVEPANIEIPTSLGNTDVYTFDFNMENILPTVAPVVEQKEEAPSFDFVPEPSQIAEINTQEAPLESNAVVSEPEIPVASDFAFNLPNLETPVSEPVVPTMEVPNVEENVTPVVPAATTSLMEEKINDLLGKEFTPNPLNNYVPERIDDRPAEVKIDEFFGRKQATPVVEEKAVEIAPAVETPVSVQPEEKPGITQGQILAKLRRLNNAMAEKDATIGSLTTKNNNLKEEIALNRDKVAEYEVRVTDLAARNSDLASQNERLSSKLEEVENDSKSIIAKLEAKVSELTQSKSEELESLRRQVEELKANHASEIASMREKHASELRLERESKEKQIQAIYSTITDALGDTIIDEDYSRNMAA